MHAADLLPPPSLTAAPDSLSPDAPEQLMNALRVPVSAMRGIGKATADTLAEEAGIHTLFDLLLFKPCGVASFRRNPDGGEANHGDKVTLTVVPRSVSTFGPGGRFVKLHCTADGLGETDLTFFRLPRSAAERMFPLGLESVVEGKLERFGSKWQIAHPVKLRALPVKNLPDGGETLRPFYHGGATIAGKQIARLIAKALEHPPRVPEWLAPSLRADMQWSDWLSSVRALHCLDPAVTPAQRAKAIERLAYDELLAYALALAKARQFRQARPARPLPPGALQTRAEHALPFRLTDGQREAVRAICEDLSRPVAMMRLLQGDVGSGKTAAALLSMCCAPEHGAQAALMAPTETLAGQLFAAASALAEKIGLRCAYLSGSLKTKARREALAAIASGEAAWIVGTHALFQEDVRFHDLGMIIIDEQHRFGVRQRMRMSEKGDNPHMLLMSATPIPRSLTLCFFGDVACSNITEKPAGRKPIDTRAISAAKLAETEARATAAVKAGKKVYWICPLVSESEELPVPSAEERFASLKPKLGPLAVLAHGKMPVERRDEALRQFKSGEARLLVATTVVEVGVDVPDATVIVIESAERFGLSQLHQLRGRVGRGAEASVCLLLHGELTRTGRERLKALRDSDDGFFLAEEDLRLRGSGDLLGVQQSGYAPFRSADWAEHRFLAERSHEESRALLDHSDSPRLALMETLCELYGYEERKALIGVG